MQAKINRSKTADAVKQLSSNHTSLAVFTANLVRAIYDFKDSQFAQGDIARVGICLFPHYLQSV